jgi:hypothetical protein
MKYLGLILLLLLFFSCNKETEDYRDDFVGKYKCHYLKTLTVYNSESGESYIDTINYSYDTIIQIQKAENNTEINFLDWNLRIQENGSIVTGYCIISDCMDCNTYPLVFSSDSIHYFTQCGGHGSFFIYDLFGVKIK